MQHPQYYRAQGRRSEVQRHTQLYAALSQCNKAIVHCASEEELFLQVCRAAVQFGGMKHGVDRYGRHRDPQGAASRQFR